jgi:hypothetical protein
MSERQFDHLVNEKWCVWLNSLDLETRQVIMREELFWFDEYVACRISPSEILAEVRQYA